MKGVTYSAPDEGSGLGVLRDLEAQVHRLHLARGARRGHQQVLDVLVVELDEAAADQIVAELRLLHLARRQRVFD